MMVTTTENIPGTRVVRTLGQVFGLTVRSRSIGGNIAAGLESLAGGEIRAYVKLHEDSRRQALDRLVENATAMGGCASGTTSEPAAGTTPRSETRSRWPAGAPAAPPSLPGPPLPIHSGGVAASADPENLSPEELTRLQPGLARLMPEIANRLWRAAYGARAGNWPLARWQLAEMRKLLSLCTITRPKYADDLAEYLHEDVEPLIAAGASEDLPAFESRLAQAIDAANEWHRRWAKGFIVWRLPGSPPPDLDLAPR